MTEEAPDLVCRIWQSDEGQLSIAPEDVPLVDRAMKEWAEKSRDSWLSLTDPVGGTVTVLASSINCMTTSTSEQRRVAILRDKAIEDERLAFRREAGFIESE